MYNKTKGKEVKPSLQMRALADFKRHSEDTTEISIAGKKVANVVAAMDFDESMNQMDLNALQPCKLSIFDLGSDIYQNIQSRSTPNFEESDATVVEDVTLDLEQPEFLRILDDA